MPEPLIVHKLIALQGKHPCGYSHEQCHETLVENLRYAVDKLASHGIKLVLEAINTKDIPGFC